MSHPLLEKLLTTPELFHSADIDALVKPGQSTEAVGVADLRAAFLRIYDLNDSASFGQADTGLMGFCNRRSNRKRAKRVNRKLRSGGTFWRIYAEGDSWFQHPLIPDIVDQLNGLLKHEDYVLFSSAMGGDWLLNYMRGGMYIEEISRYRPDIILLSGGGNDIVGGKKIANLVSREGMFRRSLDAELAAGSSEREAIAGQPLLPGLVPVVNLGDAEVERLFRGFRLLTRECYSVIWFLELCYKFLLKNVKKKFPQAKIISHGYDYVIPSARRAPFIRPKQALLNRFMDNGHWLLDALLLRNITDPREQRDVMFTIIYCFNEMLIRVGSHAALGEHVHHVDTRGTAAGPRDWFDEMHLRRRACRRVSEKFCERIREDSRNR